MSQGAAVCMQLGLPVVRKGWARRWINPWESGSEVNHNSLPLGPGHPGLSMLSNAG